MNKTILERYQTLPISFEYIYKQVSVLALQTGDLDNIDELKAVADWIGLSKDETLLLAIVYYCQDQKAALTIPGLHLVLGPYLGGAGALHELILTLIKLNVITDHIYENNKELVLNSRIFQAIKKNKVQVIQNIKPVGLEKMLNYFSENLLINDWRRLSQLEEEIEYLADLNPELSIVKNVFRVATTLESFVIGSICCRQFFDRAGFDMSYLRIFIRGGIRNVNWINAQIAEGSWWPIQKKWVDILGEGFITDDLTLELTEHGAKHILSELSSDILQKLNQVESKLPQDTIMPHDIQEVQLLFDEPMKEQINDLKQLCKSSFFKKYQNSIRQGNSMQGLCILFHGESGTGKTELALQLARMSGRPLFRMDIAQISSKWVGESEKNLRAQFVRFKRFQKNRKQSPILFLNECDAILSRRFSVNNTLDQMMNSLQNILLEEMENLKGILIATTNLTGNLDQAFERRFLYKVKFELPTMEMRKKLWLQYLPQMSSSEAEILAREFPFSPAEMQNVARKQVLRQLLSRKKQGFELIESLCREEKFVSKTGRKIGF